MARLRSREAETEDVNPRRLQRGAVKRTHIDRWAVGRDEIQPGVIGDIHINPEVVQTIIEHGAGTGVGQLLTLAVTGQSFASGGAYVAPDTVVYRYGFDPFLGASDEVVWPVDAVGEIQVEFKWDTYTGGGTIEIEVDGTVPNWGVIAEGSAGSEGSKRRSVHIDEGAVVKVKVTQTSGTAKTGDVLVEFSIPDPAQAVESSSGTPPILDMRLWYKAETPGFAYADGATVDQLLDLSGNGFHSFQSVAGRRPTYVAGLLNGKAVLRFDGVDDEMVVNGAAPMSPTTGEWTSFAVAMRNGTTGQVAIIDGDVLGTDRGGRYASFSSLQAYVSAMNTANVSFEDYVGTVVAGTYYLISAVRDATSVEVWLDGVSDGPTATTGTPENQAGGSAPLALGNSPRFSAHLDGDIAEVLIWDRAMTTAERQQIEAYLAAEYGL